MEIFITNKDYDIQFNQNLPAFVFYFNDNHIYFINDERKMSHSLSNNNGNKSDIISLSSRNAN